MKSKVLLFILVIGIPSHVVGQKATTNKPVPTQQSVARLAQLVEANVLAVHAFQILLAKTSNKGDPTCYSQGKLSTAELENLSNHQARLLKSDLNAIKAWTKGFQS